MEKKQYRLCIEVLRRFKQAGVLDNLVVIGSWCVPFYREYFKGVGRLADIKTRDIDLMVPVPSRLKARIDLAQLLKDLGFVVDFKGSQGYMRLLHPELIIEFLVPEKGRGSDRPYDLPQLGLNAQALRFLGLLVKRTIFVKVEDISIRLPHPAGFALHKLIISPRRKSVDKKAKDQEMAIQILKALIKKGDSAIIRQVFGSMPSKWQRTIIRVLDTAQEKSILTLLRP